MGTESIEKIFARLQNGSDVRGVAIGSEEQPQNLTAGAVAFIAAAFADYLSGHTGKPVSELRVGVGHDSRLSARQMADACFLGLSRARCFDCGMITTPAMFQSTKLLPESFDGAVMLTASHMPSDRNGMKFFVKEGGLDKKTLAGILKKAASMAEEAGGIDPAKLPGEALPAEKMDLEGFYCEHMKKLIRDGVGAGDRPLSGLHIVEDAGNGAAGFFAEKILKPLGADISGSVYLDPDGSFPNHVPNPEAKAAMDSICAAVKKAGADLGVIFDCDGDRGAVVFSDGTEVNRNVLIALLASLTAESAPGSTVVTDSVTSDELSEFLSGKLGLRHFRYRRGYKNIIDKGIELNAAGERCELVAETSGHCAFRENDFSDDGAYLCARVIIRLAQLKAQGRKLEDMLEGFREPAEAEEVRFTIEEEDFKAYGESVLEDFRAFCATEPGCTIVEPNYEGIRVSYAMDGTKGWVLLRLSLHDPELPFNLESAGEGGLAVLGNIFLPFFGRYDKLKRR